MERTGVSARQVQVLTSYDKSFVQCDLTGDDICGQVSQFLAAPKLSAWKRSQMAAVSNDRLTADAKYCKVAHSLLSSKIFILRAAAYLLQMALQPPESAKLKPRLEDHATLINSAAMNMGPAVHEVVDRAILACLDTRKEVAKPLSSEVRLGLS